MTPLELARVIVRLEGFILLFYAIIDATYLGSYIRVFNASRHSELLTSNAGFENLCAAILRIALHILIAVFLIAKTDEIIERILGRTITPPSASDEKKTA
jgi:hypothetical protein